MATRQSGFMNLRHMVIKLKKEERFALLFSIK